MGKSASKKKLAAATYAAGDDESARGRLLAAATHLFCKNGINATGIDAIINEAGTAKSTLYKLFGSKTNLVHVVLESEGKQWREWFIGALEAGCGGAGSACPSARAPDGRRHRCGNGIAGSGRCGHGGTCRRLVVGTFKIEEAETRGHRAGAADGGLRRRERSKSPIL